MNKIFGFLLALLSSSIATSAQSYNGCLLPDNRVCTDDWIYSSSVYYKASSSNGLPVNRCSWAPTTGSTCYVSAGRNFVCAGFLCLGSYYEYDSPIQGIKNTFTASTVACPIDDYIPHMLLGVSGLGFLFIRRRLLFATATN
ncbi:MAG: hypothetical protein EOO93_23630 [Pedobacter sp.]|nr:MAG: hypothetical protein EOO93_23630 [Pedobacter sp.]